MNRMIEQQKERVRQAEKLLRFADSVYGIIIAFSIMMLADAIVELIL